LSAYEHVIYLYSGLHDSYKWTKKEIDDEELEYILDLIVTLSKVRGGDTEEQSYIDDNF